MSTAESATANFTMTQVDIPGFSFGPFSIPPSTFRTYISSVTGGSATLNTRFLTWIQGSNWILTWPTRTDIRNGSNIDSGAADLLSNGDIEITDPYGETRIIARIDSNGNLIDTGNGEVSVSISNPENICVLTGNSC
ncbi:MAG: hypothetical protein VW985_05230 [Gammaproteobacteria bacterium]